MVIKAKFVQTGLFALMKKPQSLEQVRRLVVRSKQKVTNDSMTQITIILSPQRIICVKQLKRANVQLINSPLFWGVKFPLAALSFTTSTAKIFPVKIDKFLITYAMVNRHLENPHLQHVYKPPKGPLPIWWDHSRDVSREPIFNKKFCHFHRKS